MLGRASQACHDVWRCYRVLSKPGPDLEDQASKWFRAMIVRLCHFVTYHRFISWIKEADVKKRKERNICLNTLMQTEKFVGTCVIVLFACWDDELSSDVNVCLNKSSHCKLINKYIRDKCFRCYFWRFVIVMFLIIS